MKTNESKITEELFNIVTELDARECSCNCVIDHLIDIGWAKLCDYGICLFEKLKEPSKTEIDIEEMMRLWGERNA